MPKKVIKYFEVSIEYVAGPEQVQPLLVPSTFLELICDCYDSGIFRCLCLIDRRDLLVLGHGQEPLRATSGLVLRLTCFRYLQLVQERQPPRTARVL